MAVQRAFLETQRNRQQDQNGVPFSGRYMVVGKSPLTGTWGDANSGGYFGPAIRKCGVDGIL